MIPTLAGSTRHAVALRRTSRKACCASAMPMRSTSANRASLGSGLALPFRIVISCRGAATAAPAAGGAPPPPGDCAGDVWSVRYFSTNAATPLAFSHSAARTPSLSQPRIRSAPPGATTTAAPVAAAASGRKTVRVGSLTLAMIRSPAGDRVVVSAIVQFSEPGARPGQRRISSRVCAAACMAIASRPVTSAMQRGRTMATSCLSSARSRPARCTDGSRCLRTTGPRRRFLSAASPASARRPRQTIRRRVGGRCLHARR